MHGSSLWSTRAVETLEPAQELAAPRPSRQRRGAPPAPPDRMVEGHVPDRGRLLLHARAISPASRSCAAGVLSPIATLVLVLVTLFGALPVYRAGAGAEPARRGQHLACSRNCSRGGRARLLVLCLLGFAATDFVITITLSAADATAHIIENPFVPHWLRPRVAVTLVLIARAGGGLPQGLQRGDRPRGRARRRLPRAERGRHRLAALSSRCASRRCAPTGRTRSSAQHGSPLGDDGRVAAASSRSSRSACPGSRPASPSCRWSRATTATPSSAGGPHPQHAASC